MMNLLSLALSSRGGEGIPAQNMVVVKKGARRF